MTNRLPGSYTVTWGQVAGWNTPAPEPQTLAPNGSLTFTGIYIQQTGTIIIDPNPNSLNAPWTITGPSGFSQSGNGDLTLTNRLPGSYTVTWGQVAGWNTPAPEPQTLAPNGSLTFTGIYSSVGAETLCFDFDDRSIQSVTVLALSTTSGRGPPIQLSPISKLVPISQEYWADNVNYPNPVGADPRRWRVTGIICREPPLFTAIPRFMTLLRGIRGGCFRSALRPRRIYELTGAISFSVRALDNLSWFEEDTFYFSIHFTVWDEDQGHRTYVAECVSEQMTRDSWPYYSYYFGGENFPVNSHLRRVFVQILGHIGYNYAGGGGLYLDEIYPVYDASSTFPEPRNRGELVRYLIRSSNAIKPVTCFRLRFFDPLYGNAIATTTDCERSNTYL